MAYNGHVHEAVFDLETLGMSLLIFGFGIGVAYLIYVGHRADPGRLIRRAHLVPVHKVLLNKYYLDYSEREILEEQGYYGRYRGPFIELSLWFWRSLSEAFDWFDRNIIDGVVNAIAWVSTNAGRALRKTQSGIVNHYATMMVLGMVLLVMITFGYDMIEFISDSIGG